MSNSPVDSGDIRRRRQRMSGEEYRDLLLAEGQKILIDEGLSLGADRVTFKRVFDRIKTRGLTITNASIIGRVWENQDAYQRELILEVARHDFMGEFPVTLAALADAMSTKDTSSESSRWASFENVLRALATGAMTDVMASKLWPIWVGAWTRWHINGEVWDAEMRLALSEGEGAQHARTVELYTYIFSGLGIRPRAPHDIDEWAVAVLSLLSGFAIRSAADERASRTVITSDSGEWNLLGLAIRALAHDLLEVDPTASL
jgi:hypothetical protein